MANIKERLGLSEVMAELKANGSARTRKAYRNAGVIESTGSPGPGGSTLKLGWSELDQRVKDLAVEILGPYGQLMEGDALAPDDGQWSHALLWSRAATIYAGSSEIQRNIIAERVLGLPRR